MDFALWGWWWWECHQSTRGRRGSSPRDGCFVKASVCVHTHTCTLMPFHTQPASHTPEQGQGQAAGAANSLPSGNRLLGSQCLQSRSLSWWAPRARRWRRSHSAAGAALRWRWTAPLYSACQCSLQGQSRELLPLSAQGGDPVPTPPEQGRGEWGETSHWDPVSREEREMAEQWGMLTGVVGENDMSQHLWAENCICMCTQVYKDRVLSYLSLITAFPSTTSTGDRPCPRLQVDDPQPPPISGKSVLTPSLLQSPSLSSLPQPQLAEVLTLCLSPPCPAKCTCSSVTPKLPQAHPPQEPPTPQRDPAELWRNSRSDRR